MKRSYLQLIALTSLGLAVPLLVFADTWLGAPNVPPPQGNTPGIIWNTRGLINVVQKNAEINIDGNATATSAFINGGLRAGTAVLSQDKPVNFFEDIRLESGKAFNVNEPGPATFNMANWGIKDNPGFVGPLTMKLSGDLMVDRVWPYVEDGNLGKVQARRFCFFPGGTEDCISSWPTGGGLYVQKTGDAMTGGLAITTAGIGLDVTGKMMGVNASSDFYGVRAEATGLGVNTAGGTFQAAAPLGSGVIATGKLFGVQAISSGNGTALAGTGGLFGIKADGSHTGGAFAGDVVGVSGLALTPAGDGGYFENTDTNTVTRISGRNYGMKTTGDIITDGGISVGTNVTSTNFVSTGTITAKNIKASGTIHAPNMYGLGLCTKTAFIADGNEILCDGARPIVSGIERDITGTKTRLTCCNL